MILAVALGAGAELDGVVVRQVGEARRAVGHPKAEGPASLVGDLQSRDLEAFDGVVPGLQLAHPPVAPQLVDANREVRRGHEAGHQVLGG